MRKQTNLAEVKLTSLALLSTEINEKPYSPMIVKHPFTDTGVSVIPDGKGGVEMIDLTEDDAQLRWRQSKREWADVLSAKVESITFENESFKCKLANCDPERLRAFTEMLNGQCNAEDYERWVKSSGITYPQTEDHSPTLSM